MNKNFALNNLRQYFTDVVMNAIRVIPENLVVVVNFEKFYKLMHGPITVERLKCCDWSVHKFIEVNFSKLTDSNQIFRIDFVSIHYTISVKFHVKYLSAKFLVHMNSL